MGQIANQMALELFFKIKERIKEKKKQKQANKNNGSKKQTTYSLPMPKVKTVYRGGGWHE